MDMPSLGGFASSPDGGGRSPLESEGVRGGERFGKSCCKEGSQKHLENNERRGSSQEAFSTFCGLQFLSPRGLLFMYWPILFPLTMASATAFNTKRTVVVKTLAFVA